MSDGIPLHMSYTFDLAKHTHHAVVDANGISIYALYGKEVGHLDMTAEANDLVAYRVFETDNHRYGHNHHSEANGNSHRGYAYGRATHLLAAALVLKYPFRYK